MRHHHRRLVSLPVLLLATGCARPDIPPPLPQTGESTLGEDLHQYLEDAVADGFSGAFLVARGGTIVLEAGYGLADRENRVRYGPETVFDIGSITKQFTAAAILKLEEQGRLRTSDPISRFFPGVPRDKQDITIHHLLTHGSGLVQDLGGDYDVMPRDSLVRRALASRLRWAPRTRYGYSNVGYSLLGAIIEIASGQPYEEYLDQQLFRPAGMQHTGYTIPQWPRARLAVGYSNEGRWGTPLDPHWAPDGPWWNLRANGGMLSTLGDLYRWHLALDGDLVLSASSREKLFAPHFPTDAENSRHYGYGWMISTTTRNTRLVGHSGGNGYFAADFRRYVDEDVVILMASNQPDLEQSVFPVYLRVRARVFDASEDGSRH